MYLRRTASRHCCHPTREELLQKVNKINRIQRLIAVPHQTL